MSTPTERQLELLRLVQQRQADGLSPPTVREIGSAMGIVSTNGVADHLKALRRRGLLDWPEGRNRSLRLTGAGRKAIGAPCCSCRCHEVNLTKVGGAT